jgi:hypothetical protein
VSREGVALFGAAAIHALLALAVRASLTAPAPQPLPAAATGSAGEAVIEIQVGAPLDADAGSEEAPPARVRTDAAIAEEDRGRAAASATIVPQLGPPSEPVQPPDDVQPSAALAHLPEPHSAPASPAASTADDIAVPDLDVAPRPGPIDFGIGDEGWRRWVARPGERVAAVPDTDTGRAARRPLVHAPKKSTTGGLREGLEARDRALGLGPSGRVISALRLAARHADAPQLGAASFQVTVLRNGTVEVLLSRASQPAEGWSKVAARALEDLRRKPPRIAAGRSGVRLTVDLVAEALLPNGLKSKALRGPALEALGPRAQSTAEAQKEIIELNPTAGTAGGVALSDSLVNSEVSGVYVAGQDKVCSYRAGGTPLGTLNAPHDQPDRSPGLELRVQGNCDPVNIGAKSQRIVRASVRDEVMF